MEPAALIGENYREPPALAYHQTCNALTANCTCIQVYLDNNSKSMVIIYSFHQRLDRNPRIKNATQQETIMMEMTLISLRNAVCVRLRTKQ